MYGTEVLTVSVGVHIATDMYRTVTIRAKEKTESGRTGTVRHHVFS